MEINTTSLVNNDNSTILHFIPKIETIKFLQKHKKDELFGFKDGFLRTVLHCNPDSKVVSFFLKEMPDMFKEKDLVGRNFLMCHYNKKDIIKVAKEMPSLLSLCDVHGRSFLSMTEDFNEKYVNEASDDIIDSVTDHVIGSTLTNKDIIYIYKKLYKEIKAQIKDVSNISPLFLYDDFLYNEIARDNILLFDTSEIVKSERALLHYCYKMGAHSILNVANIGIYSKNIIEMLYSTGKGTLEIAKLTPIMSEEQYLYFFEHFLFPTNIPHIISPLDKITSKKSLLKIIEIANIDSVNMNRYISLSRNFIFKSFNSDSDIVKLLMPYRFTKDMNGNSLFFTSYKYYK